MSEVPGQAPRSKVFYRGDYRDPRKEVLPGDLTVAGPEGRRFEIKAKDSKLASSGRRLALARHWTSGDHPLVGRVLVNRIWLHHFGRGIVDTPGDFGLLGQLPPHLELLDWLATELVRRGWSMKAMHRLLMTSTVYRQSSQHDPAKDALDAGNALYGRFPLLRLDGETIRDRILAASGRLRDVLYGQPVPIVEDAVGQVGSSDDKPRRSIDLTAKRSKPIAFLTAFDSPAVELNCDSRLASTARGSARLANSEFVLRRGISPADCSRRFLRPRSAQADLTPAGCAEPEDRLTGRSILRTWSAGRSFRPAAPGDNGKARPSQAR